MYFSFKLLSSVLNGLILVLSTLGYSVQFGRMHEAAVAIHETEIYLGSKIGYVDVEYVEEGELNFIINLILVFDEQDVEGVVKTTIRYGGIGQNFTQLRLSYELVKPVTKLELMIYGLPRELWLVA